MKGSTTGRPADLRGDDGYIDTTSAVLTSGATYTIKIDPQGVNTGSMTGTCTPSRPTPPARS